MNKKYSLLIHGPYSEQWLKKIKKQIEGFKYGFSKIVLVSYVNDLECYTNTIQQLGLENIEIVTVKDLINPGFFNINRQLLCVNAGLAKIESDSYVFKLRNDQVVDFNKVAEHFDDEKIITTNCYTRSDRLYHPSDMFLAAKGNLLKEYYSRPFDEKTHLMTEYENVLWCKQNPKCTAIPMSPEMELCKHYLKLKNWDIKNTKEDSYNAIRKHFIVLNSWDINFRWNKKRTNLFRSGSIILPHYFAVRPFKDGPVEHASCYMRHDIDKSLPTMKDVFYLMLSKFVWACWKENSTTVGFLRNSKNERRKIFREFLKMLPYCLVHKKVCELNFKIMRDKNA